MWPLNLTHHPWPWTLPVRRSNETWNNIFDLVTWTLKPVTWLQRFPLRWSKKTWMNVFWLGDLDLLPVTLTFKFTLGVIHLIYVGIVTVTYWYIIYIPKVAAVIVHYQKRRFYPRFTSSIHYVLFEYLEADTNDVFIERVRENMAKVRSFQ